MPTGTLPNAGSLGDPQITTGDYQTQINQLLSYVRSLKAEVDALSGTTLKEGAVRGVGTASNELVETSQLNTRLGTSGALGSMAQESDSDYVLRADIDPASPTTVWTGPSTSSDPANWTENGTGFYLIGWGSFSSEENGNTLIFRDRSTSYDGEVCASFIYPNIYFIDDFVGAYRVSKINVQTGSTSQLNIQFVKKV